MTTRPGVHTFLPLPARSLQTPQPAYHQPTLISTYSHLPDRSMIHDDTSMAYYRPAPIGADLNTGFERKIERDEDVDEHLDGLCEALRNVWEGGGRGERRGGVVTWRGMITRWVNLSRTHISCSYTLSDGIYSDQKQRGCGVEDTLTPES